MEDKDLDVPLLKSVTTVGILYNLKKGVRGRTDDSEAEYDSMETVQAIAEAIAGGGYATVLLEADETLIEKLHETHIDIAFNIAEGIRGRGREAQVPALLNMMGIPFTGSDETTLCLALDKALTKRLLGTYHIRTPRYMLCSGTESTRMSRLSYPAIVKPNAEGSSKGISGASVVSDRIELNALLKTNLWDYDEDMLVEEYIEGREFTVGILGNGSQPHVFDPMEIVYTCATQGDYHVYDYTVKQDYTRYVTYECPAPINSFVRYDMMQMARRAFQALGCRDFARVDFRMDADGKLYFIEINPLPGLAPGYSDYPMLAEKCGMPYDELVRSILHTAMKRLGMTPACEVN